MQSLECSDGVSTPKTASSVDDPAALVEEIRSNSARLIRVPTNDEGIAGIGDLSKDSSANSAAQAPEIMALRRQFDSSSVSDPVGMMESDAENGEALSMTEIGKGVDVQEEDSLVTKL